MRKDITYVLITLAIIVGVSVAANKLNAPSTEIPGTELQNVAVTLRIEELNLAEKYTIQKILKGPSG